MQTNCLYVRKVVFIKTELNTIPTFKGNFDGDVMEYPEDKFFLYCNNDPENDHVAYGPIGYEELTRDMIDDAYENINSNGNTIKTVKHEADVFYENRVLIHTKFTFENTVYRIVYVHEKNDKFFVYAYHDASTNIIKANHDNIWSYEYDEKPTYIKDIDQDFIVPDDAFANGNIYCPENEIYISNINNYLNKHDQIKGYIDDNGNLKITNKPIENRIYFLTKELEEKSKLYLQEKGIRDDLAEAFHNYYYSCIEDYEISKPKDLIHDYCKNKGLKIKDLQNILGLSNTTYNSRIRHGVNRATIEEISKILNLNKEDKLNLYYSFGLYPDLKGKNFKEEFIKKYLNRNKEIDACQEIGATKITDIYDKTGFYAGYLDKKNSIEPGRDLILAVSLALHLSINETEDALNAFGYGGLNNIVDGRIRDWVIKFCLDNKQYSIEFVNFLLRYLKEKPLFATHNG